MEIISLWFSIAHLGYIAELLIVWTCRRRYCLANKLYMRCFKLLLLLWNEKEADRITLDLPQKKCVLSFSAYCPQDNVEEALLLLLISESMVSQKWACNTNSTKEYLVFPSQVFWLVLCTESSLDKEKQGFTAEQEMLFIPILVTLLLLNGPSVKGFGNCQEEEVTAFTVALCRFWHPDTLSVDRWFHSKHLCGFMDQEWEEGSLT